MKALIREPEERDAKFLSMCIRGWGKDDALLIELLCGKSGTQMKAIKAAYQRIGTKSLEEDILGQTFISSSYKALIAGLLEAKRDPDSTLYIIHLRYPLFFLFSILFLSLFNF